MGGGLGEDLREARAQGRRRVRSQPKKGGPPSGGRESDARGGHGDLEATQRGPARGGGEGEPEGDRQARDHEVVLRHHVQAPRAQGPQEEDSQASDDKAREGNRAGREQERAREGGGRGKRRERRQPPPRNKKSKERSVIVNTASLQKK